jgi:hypothetical protein
MPSGGWFMSKVSSRRWIGVAAAALAVVCALATALTAPAVLAQGQPLSFYKNYFVTGDYAVSGVGLRGTGDGSGFATGTIPLPTANPVPAGADIVAAFLYWQTVEKGQSIFAGQNGFFNSHAITGTKLGNDNAPVSWSAGGCAGASNGTTTLRTYRADVRPFLNTDHGAPRWTAADSYQVRLADSGSNGGGTPLTLGASLVVIYRTLGADPARGLRAVTIYDGTFAPSNATQSMTLGMQGFYQASSTAPAASLTEIVGNGQPNKGEQVTFNNSPVGGSFPFQGPWDTFQSAVTIPSGYIDEGNPIQTSVVPSATNSGCVSWGAIILATNVQSQDNDGLLDIWKTNSGYPDYSNNNDPVSLANPHTPGSQSLTPRDLYVQIDWLASHDFITSGGTQGHSHKPKQAAIDMVGAAFSAHGVKLHVDCGASCYPGDLYTITGGTGGNVIDEDSITCQDQPATQNSPAIYCQFPGVVAISWKGGFEILKDSPKVINPPGTPLAPPRFQHGRKDSYHYVLFGHALGLASNVWSITGGNLKQVVVNNDSTATVTTIGQNGLPPAGGRIRISGALAPQGSPAGEDFALNGTYPSFTNGADNNTFSFSLLTANVPPGVYNNAGLFVSSGPPLSTSGWSDFAGADSLITLGLWRSDVAADDQVGSVLVQAGTLMHELGHTLGLQHGGADGVNCKSNFQSTMNYLFQVRGLIDVNGTANVDYSGQILDPLDEHALLDLTGIGGTIYGTRWYAPFSSLDTVINNLAGGHAATRHCDGTAIGDGEPSMVRLDGPNGTGAPLDWNNDGQQNGASDQDINFNGKTPDASFRDYNEWTDILDLRQMGARKGAFGFSAGVWGTLDVGAGGTLEVGAGGTLDVGAGGTLDVGAGGTLDVGAGGTLDNGAGGTLDVGAGGQESNFTQANTTVDPPLSLSATPGKKSVKLNWFAPGFGQIRTYFVWRALNPTSGAFPPASSFQIIATLTGTNAQPIPPTTFTDNNVKTANGTSYTYFVTAALGSPSKGVPGNQSGPSSFVKVTF